MAKIGAIHGDKRAPTHGGGRSFTLRRIVMYLSDPQLFTFFFLLRLFRIYTRLTGTSVNLSTREMKAGGITRTIRSGQIYFSYKDSTYPERVALGRAMDNIKDFALRYCIGRGLDIGANDWPLPGATAVDNRPHENAYELDSWSDGSLDFVFSSHCLEHLEKWQFALALWCCKLKSGGILFLYLPHSSMTLWEPGSPWVGHDHVWSPTPELIIPELSAAGMEIIRIDPGPDSYFSFHIIARRLN